MANRRPASSDMSDVEIVIAAQAGSDAAFEVLVRRYQQPILRFLVVRCGTLDLAEDLTQTTFIAAFERLHQLNNPEFFTPWLYQIARHSWQMYLRHRSSQRVTSLEQVASRHTLPNALIVHQSEMEHLDQRELVWQALGALNPTLRDALWLRHVVGFSDSEIAVALDISPAAAQKRAYRAEIEFRTRYDDLDRASTNAADSERQPLGVIAATSRSMI